jgi:hypothetical protein
MVNHLYAGHSQNHKSETFGSLISLSQRSIIKELDDYTAFKNFELYPLAVYQFNLFLDGFFKMKPGDYGQFNFPIQPIPKKGRKQKLVEKFNNQLIKVKSSYVIQKKNIQIPVHSRDAWLDFVMYFIGKNRPFIRDYYLINTQEKLVFLFQKK